MTGETDPEVESERGPVDSDPEEVLTENPALADRLRRLFAELGADAAPAPSTGPCTDLATDLATDLTGRVLGDYRVIREIGHGGMATVYEAEQLSLRRRVALKVLAPHLALSVRAVRRFRREAVAGGRLSHPGIVSTYAVDEAAGAHLIAMELVEGGATLADLLESERRGEGSAALRFRPLATLIAQVAEALEYAHACEIVHRDVKPSNILLDPGGRPKVGDFGLARVEDSLALSGSGDFIGTPYYMSPEQASRAGTVDHRSDIYSLGATLYEALTLEVPYAGSSSVELVQKILAAEPRDPRKVNPRVPKDLAWVCLKAMEKDPARRYRSMAALAAELQRFARGEPVLARPAGLLRSAARWVGRHRLASIATAALLVTASAWVVAGLAVAQRRSSERRLAEQRYEELAPILGPPGFRLSKTATELPLKADERNPAGLLLAALHDAKSGSLEHAATKLQACIAACSTRGELDLELDALYLLGVVGLELAREAPPDEREARRRAPLEHLAAAGPFDPVSRRQLVRRETDLERATIRGLRIDSEHPLVSLYRALAIYEVLYEGGRREAFEQSILLFERVLEARPDDDCALALLARAQFFFARTHGFVGLLEPARELLERAEAASGDRPHFMIPTTRGQILLLLGRPDSALAAFEQAERALAWAGKRDKDKHNVFKGLGQVRSTMGEPEAARELMIEAARRMPGDTHVAVAHAELHLPHDPAGALEHARNAVGPTLDDHGQLPPARRQASALLACARAHLALGEEREALAYLHGLTRADTVSAPRDFTTACRLLASLDDAPEDLASQLGAYLGLIDYTFRDLESAVYPGGRGAALLAQGRSMEAAVELREALRIRGSWPAALQRGRRFDEGCDLYLLATALARVAETRPESEPVLARAEELYHAASPPAERPDVLERLRTRALEARRVR